MSRNSESTFKVGSDTGGWMRKVCLKNKLFESICCATKCVPFGLMDPWIPILFLSQTAFCPPSNIYHLFNTSIICSPRLCQMFGNRKLTPKKPKCRLGHMDTPEKFVVVKLFCVRCGLGSQFLYTQSVSYTMRYMGHLHLGSIWSQWWSLHFFPFLSDLLWSYLTQSDLEW